MATFPPKNASKTPPAVKVTESTTVSTGGGGIPASLKVKAAGTTNAPGLEKNVNLF